MSKVEYVDIYDRNKNKTGMTKIRHVDTLEDGEYIIGVQLVILNENNEILRNNIQPKCWWMKPDSKVDWDLIQTYIGWEAILHEG